MMKNQFSDGFFRHPVLSGEEERALLVEVAAERERWEIDNELDCPARTKLVLHNLRLAVYWAKRHQGNGLDLEDLVSEAICGILKAADLFDLSRSNRFSTYASYWVLQYVRRAVANRSRTVRLPANAVNDMVKVRKINERYLKKHGRPAKRHEIIRHLKCTGRRADEVIKVLDQRCISLNVNTMQECLTSGRFRDPTEEVEMRELANAVENALRYLPKKYQLIVRLWFGVGCRRRTLQEIANLMGLTRERIRQLKDLALKRLKKVLKPKLVDA